MWQDGNGKGRAWVVMRRGIDEFLLGSGGGGVMVMEIAACV